MRSPNVQPARMRDKKERSPQKSSLEEKELCKIQKGRLKMTRLGIDGIRRKLNLSNYGRQVQMEDLTKRDKS